MITDEQLDRELREIAQAGAAGGSIASDVMQQIEGESIEPARPTGSWRRIAGNRSLKWLIPAAAAAAIILAVGLWPEARPRANGIAWGSVVRQFNQARFARVESRYLENGEVTEIIRTYLQAPDKMRCDTFEPDGETSKHASRLELGDRIVEWNPQTRLYAERRKNPNEHPQRVAQLLGVLGLPLTSVPSIEIDGVQLHLESKGEADYERQQYLRYGIMIKAPALEGSYGPELWFDPKTHEARLLYESQPGEGGAKREVYNLITLNPEVPPSAFEVPTDLIDVEDGIWPRLSPELRGLAEKYYAARDRLDRYRSVITRAEQSWPRYREVRKGSRWRSDRLDLGAMLNQRDKYCFTGVDQPFEEVWAQISDPNTLLEGVLMPRTNGLARAGYDYSGPEKKRSQWVCDRGNITWRDYEMHLAELGWPLWVDDEMLAPHGWVLSEAPLTYALHPPEPEQPRLIRVSARRDSNWRCWYEYQIDPERDYLCVRLEQRDFVRLGDAPEPAWRVQVREVVECGQTPEGHWYPRVVVHRSGQVIDGTVQLRPLDRNSYTRVMLDTVGEIDDRFLKFPESAAPLDSEPPAISRWRVSDRRLKPPALRSPS